MELLHRVHVCVLCSACVRDYMCERGHGSVIITILICVDGMHMVSI